MIYLAFYRGEGRFLSDTVVQWITRSDFSHCELFESNEPPSTGETHTCVTAVGKDGGVRVKDVTFTLGRWDIVAVPWAPKDAVKRAIDRMGAGYDYLGLAMTQFFNLRRHNPDRLFCSKLCALALGLDEAHTYAPGDLKRIVEEHNRHFLLAELNAARTGPVRYDARAPLTPNPSGGRFIRTEGDSFVTQDRSDYGTVIHSEGQWQSHVHQSRQHPVRPRQALRGRIAPTVVARSESFGRGSTEPLQLNTATGTGGNKVVQFPSRPVGQ